MSNLWLFICTTIKFILFFNFNFQIYVLGYMFGYMWDYHQLRALLFARHNVHRTVC